MTDDFSGVEIGFVDYGLGNGDFWESEERCQPFAVDTDTVADRVVLHQGQRESEANYFHTPLHFSVRVQWTALGCLRYSEIRCELSYNGEYNFFSDAWGELLEDTVAFLEAMLDQRAQ